jgi:hypothetical protein
MLTHSIYGLFSRDYWRVVEMAKKMRIEPPRRQGRQEE